MKLRNKKAVKRYHSPIPEGITSKIVYSKGERSHEKHPEIRYAKDFITPEGTPIEAMEEGKVAYVKSDSNEYGFGEEYAYRANFVIIMHKDGTFTEYYHLGQDQIYVKPGDKVKKGQIIGLSGLSGQMRTPHLHANRFKLDGEKKVSLPYEVDIPYDVEVLDENNRPVIKKKKTLETIVEAIFIVSSAFAIFFFSRITGNVVGVSNGNFLGLVFIAIGLICGGIWILLKKSEKI